MRILPAAFFLVAAVVGSGAAGRRSYETPPIPPPIYQGVRYQSPVYEAPHYKAPVYGAPVYHAPRYQSPFYEYPVHHQLVYQIPGISGPLPYSRRIAARQLSGQNVAPELGSRERLLGELVRGVAGDETPEVPDIQAGQLTLIDGSGQETDPMDEAPVEDVPESGDHEEESFLKVPVTSFPQSQVTFVPESAATGEESAEEEEESVESVPDHHVIQFPDLTEFEETVNEIPVLDVPKFKATRLVLELGLPERETGEDASVQDVPEDSNEEENTEKSPVEEVPEPQILQISESAEQEPAQHVPEVQVTLISGTTGSGEDTDGLEPVQDVPEVQATEISDTTGYKEVIDELEPIQEVPEIQDAQAGPGEDLDGLEPVQDVPEVQTAEIPDTTGSGEDTDGMEPDQGVPEVETTEISDITGYREVIDELEPIQEVPEVQDAQAGPGEEIEEEVPVQVPEISSTIPTRWNPTLNVPETRKVHIIEAIGLNDAPVDYVPELQWTQEQESPVYYDPDDVQEGTGEGVPVLYLPNLAEEEVPVWVKDMLVAPKSKIIHISEDVIQENSSKKHYNFYKII